MSNKINNGLPLPGLSSVSNTVSTKAKARVSGDAVAASPTISPVDRVEISNEGIGLTALSQQHGNEPSPIDQQKVEAVRTAIANGTFNVDATRIAKRLSQFEQELSA